MLPARNPHVPLPLAKAPGLQRASVPGRCCPRSRQPQYFSCLHCPGRCWHCRRRLVQPLCLHHSCCRQCRRRLVQPLCPRCLYYRQCRRRRRHADARWHAAPPRPGGATDLGLTQETRTLVTRQCPAAGAPAQLGRATGAARHPAPGKPPGSASRCLRRRAPRQPPQSCSTAAQECLRLHLI